MKRLIKHLKRKKPIAQKQLFEEYSEYLFHIAYRYVNDRELAEEILSTSFLKTFEKIDSTDLEEKGKLMAWMKRITINLCLMELRRNKLEMRSLELVIHQVDQESYPTEGEYSEKEILQHVQLLPKGYQTVFYLYVVDDYTHEEISERLGIAIGTSKSQLSKAKQMLRESLKNKNSRYAAICE